MTGSVGFFGKLPGVGDFVQRRLPPAFVAAWDAGFEAAVAGARAAMGDSWHAVWQTAPAWRFALAPGVCGASAWVGVMGPSVDRVGRGFPMVLASAVGATDAWVRIVREGANWFAELERTYRDVGANVSADAFDAAVQALPDAAAWLAEASPQPTAIDWSQGDVVRKPWQPGSDDRVLAVWVSACADIGNGCLWWAQGDSGKSPRALLTRGLPTSRAYAEFLVAEVGVPSVGVAAAHPVAESVMVSRSGHPDSLLDDLLSDSTVPAAVVAATNQAPASMFETAAIVVVPSASQPASAVPVATAKVAHGEHGATWWLAADNGPGDPRRQAAARAGQVLAEVDDLVDLDAVRTRLLALHAPLRERGEDLIDPVAEDGAVVVAQLDAGRAALLRVGAANAWHWRRGQLRPTFVGRADASDQDATVRPGDLMDVLSATPSAAAGGLGAAMEPGCEVVSCVVADGDRLVLLATDTLTRLSAETLAASLAETTSEEARSRIAAAAGLGTDRAHWPLAVIEVGT